MTDAEKLLAIGNYLFTEGIRVEDSYKLTMNHRMLKYRDCDQLDLMELIELKNRWDYYAELAVMIENILYDRYEQRPRYNPLTGLRYDGNM